MVKGRKIISSSDVAKLAHIPFYGEPAIPQSQNSLIYIGDTAHNHSPFFLDFAETINPHIFVFGMSGGGKSYLIKSMMLRMSVFANSRILLIDFTGEYAEFVDYLFYKEADAESIEESLDYGGISYLNLAKNTEQEKLQKAKQVLQRILAMIRNRGVSKDYNLFIVLDEAWKLLINDDTLNVLIREGRKYGVGLVLASQLLNDISEKFLANVATVFAFRMQDAGSVDALVRNYELDMQSATLMQNLEVGQCIVIQVHKNRPRSTFMISKVKGVNLKKPFTLIGDSMRIEIEDAKFTGFLKGLGLNETQITVMKSFFAGDYSVELSRLISELVSLNVDRREILKGLRQIGIGDREIADAFAEAVSGGGNNAD
ncbi:MAG: ATP-binding protein [Candidatus Micrarchaeales archaeon]